VASKSIREGSVKKGGVNPPTNTPRPKGQPYGQRPEPDLTTFSSKELVKLVGGPFDGEMLVDRYNESMDRFNSNSGKSVRYYRDPGNQSCFLVEDWIDARLLIYKVRELSKQIDALERKADALRDRCNGLADNMHYHKTWWRKRVRNVWNRAG
jgi:hypothetical protein